jgi:hemolysin activation/secretion protein
MPRHPKRRLLAAAASTLCALWTTHPWAQSAPPLPTAPDAGQILRNLQSPLAPNPGQLQAPPPQSQQAPAATAADEQTKVLIKSIRLSGNQDIPSATLEGLLTGLIGQPQSLAQLNNAARRITNYYRAQGYAVARAYLPAQDITDGQVTISIIEGRIDSYRIRNQSRLADATTAAYLAQIKSGSTIKSDQIDRSLLLLQDTPGVGGSRATLQPGASVGTSELLIELDPAQAITANASLDNYGSRYTGEVRASANAALASPLQLGDQLALNLLSSGSALSFARIAYQIPLGSDGLKAGAAYFDTRYRLGKEFAALDATGQASSTSVFAAYPFIRSQQANLSGTAAYEHKRLSDRINSTATATYKQVKLTSIAMAGNLQDSLAGGGITSADISLALGQLNINSPAALALDAAAQTNGRYSRIAYSASRLQRVSDSSLIQLQLAGQQASKNLDSSEKFALGGANAIRAYPQGEASGDEGLRATVELRQTLSANLQGIAFYDWGNVKTSKNPFGAAAASNSNSRSLGGAGIGLNASFDKVQLKAALAWRTRGGLPTSIPATAAKRPTLLVLAQVAF